MDPATPVPPGRSPGPSSDDDESLIGEVLVNSGIREAESELREEVEGAYLEEALSSDDREAGIEELAFVPDPDDPSGDAAPELGALKVVDAPEDRTP